MNGLCDSLWRFIRLAAGTSAAFRSTLHFLLSLIIFTGLKIEYYHHHRHHQHHRHHRHILRVYCYFLEVGDFISALGIQLVTHEFRFPNPSYLIG
jgi:hypothetical protein